MRWLLFLVVYLCSGVFNGMTLLGDDDGEGNNLSETVKVLKSKVDALFDRRQEDFRLLEEAFRTTLEKNLDLVSLREEVARLKKELAGASQRNDHVKLQWLSDGLAELKAEVAELQNSTRATSEAVAHARSEVTELKRDATSLRNLQTKISTKVKNVEAKMRASKLQFSRMNYRDDTDTNRVDVDMDQTQFRHHRVLRKRLEVVEMSSEALGQAQARLETKLQHLEHRIRLADTGKEKFRTYEPSFEQRLLTLEESDKIRAANLLNVTRQMSGLDKLHSSMLELLESVETIENKVDKSIPDLKSEISKMEFGSAQLTSTLAIVKEIQDNQQLSVKAMSSGISAMQDKMDTDRSRLLSLEMQLSKMKNFTDNHNDLHKNLSSDILTSFATNDKMNGSDNVTVRVSFPVTMQHLTRIINEYNAIRENLPNDCSEVRGPSGLYIITPGESLPQLTWCDQDTGAGGWTVIQRRKDGSQKFNRNWNEYVLGFGSAEGEFWMGNEAIHQLTRDNDTTLRIDLVDIYGKVWHAEYDEFSVTSSDDSYRLHVSGYHGNASDALEYQNHMQFSTIDKDHDVSNTNCAANYEGGWWFSHCQHANLNGKYNMGLTWFDRNRNEWIAVARSEMKLRRRVAPADRT